ncbi:hypothetical protein [Nitrosopumilus zosterae]|nr:hypothetical protein [Nitrosopumilus zosterae]BDQ30494.1 hypothetical protein NZOSNM25_000598 [Nitrosopumilus zosterae]
MLLENTPDIVVILVPLIISITAIVISIYTAKKSEDVRLYSSLDNTYTQLMKVGVDHPDFRDPHKTNNYKKSFDGSRLYGYESYAFMSINMVATVYDRYKKIPRTWYNIIKIEGDLHKSWFYDNSQKFRDEFVDFIDQKIINSKKN